MSFTVARCLANAGFRMSKIERHPAVLSMLGTMSSTLNTTIAAPPRVPARSLWYMSRATLADDAVPTGRLTQRCSCCQLHTKGDQELTNFLKEEIAGEMKSKVDPVKIAGFEVKSTNGAEVTLQKTDANETITIRLNVNGSVDDEMNMEDGQSKDEPEAKMVSRPPFVVEISKGGASTLAVQCSFPTQDDMMESAPAEDQQYEDLIELQEITLLKGEKWNENTYCVQGSMLDGNLYDMLLNMLEERGIDAQSIDQLVEYSTSYEHQNYIAFLEGLKEFASSK